MREVRNRHCISEKLFIAREFDRVLTIFFFDCRAKTGGPSSIVSTVGVSRRRMSLSRLPVTATVPKLTTLYATTVIDMAVGPGVRTSCALAHKSTVSV